MYQIINWPPFLKNKITTFLIFINLLIAIIHPPKAYASCDGILGPAYFSLYRNMGATFSSFMDADTKQRYKVEWFIGKKLLEVFNNILKRIPILRTIYSAIVQMTETFTKNDDKKKSVVLVEYPRKGSWAVGFATKDNTGEISAKTKKQLINVFVPTTPNPTSGFLLMFPKEDVIHLDLSFEEASKFIVSAGTTEPE